MINKSVWSITSGFTFLKWNGEVALMTRTSWHAFGIAVFTEFSLGYFILLEEVISFNPLMHHFIRFWVSVRNSFPVRRKLTPSILPHSWDTSETQSSFGSFVTPSHHFHSWEDRPFGLDLIFIIAYYTVTNSIVRH